ncbi:hypothetical protein BV898_16217 [Hypsibius exemplaris]|uniref:Uncharacterized protein n=1 Tax=Hypsibius exemplaris TaxID=2072580 RepID=A0A9X6NCU0_HYPEX|nr:hypothetical protein BV898_16217 [Hypsibius exemplaris]
MIRTCFLSVLVHWAISFSFFQIDGSEGASHAHLEIYTQSLPPDNSASDEAKSVTFRPTEGTITAITATRPHETTSSSWVPSWFPGSPLRPTTAQPVEREKPPAKQLQVGFDVPEGAGPPQRNRRDQPAPVKLTKWQQQLRYDTLKERADIWKKEKRQRPARVATVREDSFVEKEPDHSRKHRDFTEDTGRPKIRFTQEESDKVDKDILRLMGALEHNRYPFNRDKHLLFNKLRLVRRKQMGLLFAHRELDGTGYFDTDREDFGYDLVSDQLGTMYNVIDAISRDVYELRELLYYERKNQTPPTRRGSSDRRTSSEPPPVVHITKPTVFPTRSTNPPLSSFDGIDGTAAAAAATLQVKPSILVASSPKLQAPSPTRPILKHSLSTESFKSAKSDDTLHEATA